MRNEVIGNEDAGKVSPHGEVQFGWGESSDAEANRYMEV